MVYALNHIQNSVGGFNSNIRLLHKATLNSLESNGFVQSVPVGYFGNRLYKLTQKGIDALEYHSAKE